MRWTAARNPAVAARQAEIARLLHIARPDTSDREASNQLTDRLTGLIADLSLPERFRDVGIGPERLQTVARRFTQREASLVAGESTSYEQVLSLLETML